MSATTERLVDIAGDAHGAEAQEEPKAQENLGQQQAAQGQLQMSGADREKSVDERDDKIAALEAQVAEAAMNAETAERLRGIVGLKAQFESDRIDFKLQLAGVRNVKAARALLGDHGNDVDKLKEAEPQLFEATGKHAKGGSDGSGTTGLPNVVVASDESRTLKQWREISGLTDDDSDDKKN